MTSKVKTWIYATRPHTLGASIAPMLIALGALIADNELHFGLYLLCFIVAVSAQISSNFANDYFDYRNGKDTDQRIGFRRLITTGEVTERQMLVALLIALAICAVAGFTLAALQGWDLLIIGAFVLLGALAYSSGPFPLSHYALGDLAVVLFYGLVPVLGTYYAIAGVPPIYLLFLALGIGIWEVNILVCNNYRDYEEDKESGKRTLIVRMGEASAPILYLINSLIAIVMLVIGIAMEGSWIWAAIVGIIALFFFGVGVLSIRRLRKKSLNKLLKYTNTISLLIGLLTMVALIF